MTKWLDFHTFDLVRLSAFKSNKGFVKAARQLCESDTWIKMREVLEEESPLHRSLSAQGPSEGDRSHMLGLILGYQECLDRIKDLSTPLLQPKQIEQTYSEE